MKKRIVCVWFPRLASERILRLNAIDGPFVLTRQQSNRNQIHCLNQAAENEGLFRGMSASDARAFCPTLRSYPACPPDDAHFLKVLRRWATGYCPWVGLEGDDGLVLNISGSAHLFDGEEALIANLHHRLERAGLSASIGLADTRGAAWALSRFGGGCAEPGQSLQAIKDLPVSGLRLAKDTEVALKRLGFLTIGKLTQTERAPLARRFGLKLLERLDQALGAQSEEITPLSEPPHYATRMTFPEPIGLLDDVREATARLLRPLCDKLSKQRMGARSLQLILRRADQQAESAELKLARPMNDPKNILPLFERGLSDIDAGFGIDQMRLIVTLAEPFEVQQLDAIQSQRKDRVDHLITKIGTRIGLENIKRYLSVDSHLPERSFITASAAYVATYQAPAGQFQPDKPRPVLLFPPEQITGDVIRYHSTPPETFRWRRMNLTTALPIGPERITPEWWHEDENWRSGVRDYWRVQTLEGRRLWLYFTPQQPAWFVQGEFA